MKSFNENKKIEYADDFNDYASEIFDRFLETFTKENGLLRDATEDDYGDCNYYYTDKGMKLADRMKSRLTIIGETHFPMDDIEIWSSLYQEI